MKRNLASVVLMAGFALGCAHAPTASNAGNGQANASQTGKDSSAALQNGAGATTTDSSNSSDNQKLTCGPIMVHFPFNSTDIEQNDRVMLEQSAACLKHKAGLHVTVEGNADERGTEEYNMALGDKRAAAVAHYLESLGASPSQIKTVSFGKENPVCSAHDEECWSQNRRAALKPNGSNSMKND